MMKRIPFASTAALIEAHQDGKTSIRKSAPGGRINFRLLLAAFTGLAITAGAAHATVFTGTDTFTDTTPGNDLNLTARYDLNPITFNLTAGQTFSTHDLLTITSTDSANPGFWGSSSPLTDNIKVTFAFTAPSAGTGSTDGSGTETVDSFFGYISSNGDITWDNPNTITFADGAALSVSLGNTSLSGTGTTISGVVSASFKDVKDPTAVPEPMSLAALGSGLIGLGMVRRKRA